jgi:hypothetical protein
VAVFSFPELTQAMTGKPGQIVFVGAFGGSHIIQGYQRVALAAFHPCSLDTL